MESELKLTFSADKLPALLSLPLLASARVEPPSDLRLSSTYYDTVDLQVHRRGASLRVRDDGESNVQTLKLAPDETQPVFVRAEYESPVGEGSPDLPALRKTMPRHARLDALFSADLQSGLRPVFSTEVQRSVSLLRLPDNTEIEVAIDRGVVRAGEQTNDLCEVELELRRGKLKALYGFALELLDEVSLGLSFSSKSDRGYALVAGEDSTVVHAKPLALRRSSSIQRAFGRIAGNCLSHIRGNERGVAAGNSTEAVHQMRVGIRRLRSAIDIFEDAVAFPPDLADQLKWLADELGHARDWDVLANVTLKKIPAGESGDLGLASLREAATGVARASLARASEAVRSCRYARLSIRLSQWLAAKAWRDTADASAHKLQASPVRGFAADTLRSRHRRLIRRGQGLHKLQVHERHRARIAAKKLRYAADFFASLLPPKALRKYRKSLSRLQDDLGWTNDMAVADGLLAGLQESDSGARPGAIFARGYVAAQVADDRESLRRLWKSFKAVAPPV